MEYAKRLRRDYVAKFGRKDTVGFSIIGSRPERIQHIPEIYGDKPPYVFDFHFYGDQRADEYEHFVNAHQQMKEMGYDQGSGRSTASSPRPGSGRTRHRDGSGPPGWAEIADDHERRGASRTRVRRLRGTELTRARPPRS